MTRTPNRIVEGVRARRWGSAPRYLLVGSFNSLVDLGLFSLFALVLDLAPTLASIFSTSITLCMSYVLNRLFVFQTNRSVKGTMAKFVAVTLSSGLLIQPAVIWAVISVGEHLAPGMSHNLLAPISKICAMGVGMVSNYLGYRWLFGQDELRPTGRATDG